jgi:hypothetical protein
VYSSLQAAVDSSQAGDTVYVAASPTTYGNVTINKQLTLFGMGANPQKDMALGSPVNQLSVDVGGSGSFVSGLTIAQMYLGVSGHAGTVSGIVIEKNRIASLYSYYNTVSNILFRLNTLGYLYFGSLTTNCRIVNNVFTGAFAAYVGFNGGTSTADTIAGNLIFAQVNQGSILDCRSPIIVMNNVLVSQTGSTLKAFGFVTGSTFANNIFFGIGTGVSSGGSLQGNVFLNNISYGNSDDALPPVGTGSGNSGSGNLVGTDPGFASIPFIGASLFLNSFDFHRTGAQKGTDGKEIGIYGGPYPFPVSYSFLSGSTLPVVQSLGVGGVIKAGDSLHVLIRGTGE